MIPAVSGEESWSDTWKPYVNLPTQSSLMESALKQKHRTKEEAAAVVTGTCTCTRKKPKTNEKKRKNGEQTLDSAS